ncbi:MAG: carboxypeptidase-like regulatory domain-containing protein, partial [Blastocatellia bacterium]
MKSKNLMAALLRIGTGCALLSLLTVSAFAQLGRIEGEVVKAGTTEPVIGATVEIVRMDIKGNYPLKSDKKGKFLHAGVPYVGKYTILVSADGFEPTFLGPDIRPTGEPIKIELRPGDGRKITIDDVKKMQAGGKGAAPAAGGAAAPKMTAEEAKKAKEEYEKAMADRGEAEKFNTSIQQINLKLKEGNDAMAKPDLPAAIAAFKEAVALNPSIHISNGNLAIALQKRAVSEFNGGQRDPAKQDFIESVAASNKAIEGLDAQEKDTKIKNDPVQNKANRRTYHVVRAESESILGTKFGDGAQADAAVKDYQMITSLTDDPAEKKKYPLKAATLLRETAGKQAEAV